MKRVVDIFRGIVFGVVRDRRGGVATFIAATVIPLVAFSGLALDTTRGYLMKSRLSYALDAAALAGGRAWYDPDPTKRDAMIQKFFDANFPDNYMGATITGPNIVVNTSQNTITLTASADMSTSLMRALGLQDMEVGGATEVKLSSVNLEVSLVVDITGSMSGQKIEDLKIAAKDLVDIIVKDSQTPFYSRVALVPYAMAVNVGSYAAQVRGAVPAPREITNAWRTDPVTIESPNHGFVNGQLVYVDDVDGMWQINDKQFTVTSATQHTFKLYGVDGDDVSSYDDGGNVWAVCTTPGCEVFRFRNAYNGNWRTHRISNCVTERTGAYKYDDVAPTTALVGPSYPNTPGSIPGHNGANPCPPNPIIPLTSDRTMLKNAIENLEDGGSTAGQIGLAWGWYMVSPNFAYLWPADRQGGAYGEPDLMKVVIFMTDGELNTAFADGVIAEDSGSGSGSSRDKINKDATNGSSFDQALALCSAIKSAGILVYTVGFDVGSIPAAENLVQQCATDPSYVYLPDGGSELKEAFNAIAVNVSQLRLSK